VQRHNLDILLPLFSKILQNFIVTTQMLYTLMYVAFWLNVEVPVFIKLWKSLFFAAEAKT